jgi:hypothetical protein
MVPVALRPHRGESCHIPKAISGIAPQRSSIAVRNRASTSKVLSRRRSAKTNSYRSGALHARERTSSIQSLQGSSGRTMIRKAYHNEPLGLSGRAVRGLRARPMK